MVKQRERRAARRAGGGAPTHLHMDPSSPWSIFHCLTRSGAEKLSSSTIFSSTVCSRLAPMLSTVRFTSAATAASSCSASSVNSSARPSASISAFCSRATERPLSEKVAFRVNRKHRVSAASRFEHPGVGHGCT